MTKNQPAATQVSLTMVSPTPGPTEPVPAAAPLYFHLMPPGEFKRLCAEGMTWRGLQDAGCVQPDWCSYPNALDGMMGCWSLIYQKVTGEEYCRNCECFKQESHADQT